MNCFHPPSISSVWFEKNEKKHPKLKLSTFTFSFFFLLFLFSVFVFWVSSLFLSFTNCIVVQIVCLLFFFDLLCLTDILFLSSPPLFNSNLSLLQHHLFLFLCSLPLKTRNLVIGFSLISFQIVCLFSF